MSPRDERPLTPAARAMLLAERALEACSCRSALARDVALEAIRRVLGESSAGRECAGKPT
jgi:hypothetical protein